jgi:hypothetical protein
MNEIYIIIKPDEEVRHIPAIIKNGILCQTREVGIGKATTKGGLFGGEGETWEEYENYRTEYIPVFSKLLIEKYGASFDIAKKATLKDVLDQSNILSKCIFRLGKTEAGEVLTDEEYRKRKEDKTSLQVIYKCNDLEAFGDLYKLNKRVDSATWMKIKPYIFYFEAEDECMCYGETKGWAISQSNVRKIEEVLDIPQELRVFPTDEIVIKERKVKEEAAKKEREKLEAESKRRKELIQECIDVFKDAEYVKHPDGEQFQLSGKRIDHTNDRENIYGGGQWWIIDREYIWHVRNNGMDGDNWSYNNIHTGGAGAIGHRVPYNQELAEKLKEISTF